MKEKLLLILPEIPYPLNTGGNQGSFHMLNYIKNYYDIHIWFHVNNEKKERPLIQDFCSHLNGKIHIHYTANKIGRNFITWRAIERKLSSFFLKKDIQFRHSNLLGGSYESGYADYKAINDINKIIKSYDIKFAQIEYHGVMDLVYMLPENIKKIYIDHEIIYARIESFLEIMKGITSFDIYRYKKHKSIEINLLNNYDCVITMSEIDKQKLHDDGVHVRLESSPLFIPKQKKEFPHFVSTNNRLTFIGVGGHKPNQEGLQWFIDEVHPILKSKINYQMDVIGKGWSPDSIEGVTPSNIHFLGFIPDLNEVIPGSIMIVPIRTGSGMRMKILESVNNSVPFISCKVGAEGMGFVDGLNCYIEDNSSVFASKILNLLRNKDLQKDFVLKSRTHYENNYSPEILAEKRLKILQSVFN